MFSPSNDLYVQMFARSPVGIVVLEGEELRVLHVNPAMGDRFGISGDMRGERLESVVPEVPVTVLESFRNVIRHGTPTTVREFESSVVTTAAGEPTYWNIDCQPVDGDGDGQVDSVLLMLQDVTAHVAQRREAEKRAEEAEAARAALAESGQQLAEREAMLQLALETAHIGAWEYDLATGKVRYSASRNKLYGLESEQVVANASVFLERMHPDDQGRLVTCLSRAVANGKSEVEYPFRILRADGDIRYVTARTRIVRDENNVATRIIGVDVDMTGEHVLRERLEAFARSAAHDLRSPLQTVQGFSELLVRSATERLNDKDREYLRYIIGAVKKMDGLIEGLLAYAYAANAGVVRELVDLAAVMADACDTLRIAIDAAGAEVVYGRLPVVSGYRILLVQVIQNLLTNALKFRADRPLVISVDARRCGDQWIISIRDNGLGIPRERQARLFEAFARAHEEARIPGLGLGLALVREAVARHNGRVWVESKPGEGATFFVALPDAEVAQQQGAA